MSNGRAGTLTAEYRPNANSSDGATTVDPGATLIGTGFAQPRLSRLGRGTPEAWGLEPGNCPGRRPPPRGRRQQGRYRWAQLTTLRELAGSNDAGLRRLCADVVQGLRSELQEVLARALRHRSLASGVRAACLRLTEARLGRELWGGARRSQPQWGAASGGVGQRVGCSSGRGK